MKFIRVFLAVLIVIGIILLLTQSIWVPKLVNAILKYEGSPIVVQSAETVPLLNHAIPISSYVTAPNGQDVWKAGSQHEITWTRSKSPSVFTPTVLIILRSVAFPSRGAIEIISGGVGNTLDTPMYGEAPNTGMYMWAIPSSIQPGIYKVEVCATFPGDEASGACDSLGRDESASFTIYL